MNLLQILSQPFVCSVIFENCGFSQDLARLTTCNTVPCAKIGTSGKNWDRQKKWDRKKLGPKKI